MSSDGRLMLWDVKDMSEPKDSVWLTDGAKDDTKVRQRVAHGRCEGRHEGAINYGRVVI